MTLHTLAIVLNTSVVFSIGKFLFCLKKTFYSILSFPYLIDRAVGVVLLHSTGSLAFLTSDTNFVVPSLKVFSMGVASA